MCARCKIPLRLLRFMVSDEFGRFLYETIICSTANISETPLSRFRIGVVETGMPNKSSLACIILNELY